MEGQKMHAEKEEQLTGNQYSRCVPGTDLQPALPDQRRQANQRMDDI
jgi:hypothetical protein